MEHQLTRGQALVIIGPQGSGKTTLAREIAAKHGSKVLEVCAHDLAGRFGIDNLLANNPDVIICEEFPIDAAARAKLKDLITSDTVTVNRKYQPPIKVRSPHLIFCSSGAEFLTEHDRRYRVVSVDRRPAQAT